jgi:hypothetical protein
VKYSVAMRIYECPLLYFGFIRSMTSKPHCENGSYIDMSLKGITSLFVFIENLLRERNFIDIEKEYLNMDG